MKSLRDRINEREQKRTGGMPESASFHSKNYRREFEGYSEYRELQANGKTVIKRVYTGAHHTPDLSPSRWRMQKAVYAALFLSACAFFLLGATRPSAGNSAFYVTVFQALSVPSLGWLGWSLFNVTVSGYRMTNGEFRHISAFWRASRLSAAALLLAGTGILLHLLLVRTDVSRELLCAILHLLAAACCTGCILLHKKTRFLTSASGKVPPKEAHQITL